jgi:hypothetical protein
MHLDKCLHDMINLIHDTFARSVLVLAVAWCLATVACLPSFLPNLLGFLSTLIGKLSRLRTINFVLGFNYLTTQCHSRSGDYNLN